MFTIGADDSNLVITGAILVGFAGARVLFCARLGDPNRVKATIRKVFFIAGRYTRLRNTNGQVHERKRDGY